ncbi:MAG: hypothetical protein Tsb0015_04320 [Simkaniaceae bacterium]
MKFSKKSRLLTRFDFRRVSHKGKTAYGEHLIIDYYFGKATSPKLGLTISRRAGKAHVRNRFKRVVREAFRHISHELPPNLEMNIRPKFNNFDINSLEAALEIKQLLRSHIAP